ncbi:MAG: hypothetical protein GWP16_01435 [Nitrospirae bacterium]|nr:hypothetical protein [Nitrospirota bacterium]
MGSKALRLMLVAALCVVAAFLASPVPASGADAPICLDCHETNVDAFAETVHGFAECLDCHVGADSEDHPDVGTKADCSGCHEEEVSQYKLSIHGEMEVVGRLPGDGCASCHGEIHSLVPHDDPESATNPISIAETCGACHANPDLAADLGIRLVLPMEAYTASVHSRAVQRGVEAATCSACHGSHDIQPAAKPSSHVHADKVPETCGQCHGNVTAVFNTSVHGKAVAHGIRDAPTCTDCHGEHRILEPQHDNSSVSATSIPKVTCGRCHGDLALTEKFGLEEDAVPAYEDSYHGLASRSGSVSVANCSSCHGVHDILPSEDEFSHTNPENLDETCGQCHPGAGERFAIGAVHVLPEDPEHTAVYWVRIVYLWLICLTIGGMLLHNGIDLFRKIQHPVPRPAASEVEEVERMSIAFRITHAMLAVSFIILVHSGFALKYPEAWWACPVPFVDAICQARGLVHRTAAVVMILASLIHVVHLMVDRRARRLIMGMIPNGDDLRDLKGRLEYFAGKRKHPPQTEWLSYPEKLEYLALIWGTVIMVASGFILWFENISLRWLPSWAIDVSTAVHFYEAILATLAILVWHFYAVIFDPLVYPVDPALWTGKSSPARYLERRPQKAGPDDEPLDAPADPS